MNSLCAEWAIKQLPRPRTIPRYKTQLITVLLFKSTIIVAYYIFFFIGLREKLVGQRGKKIEKKKKTVSRVYLYTLNIRSCVTCLLFTFYPFLGHVLFYEVPHERDPIATIVGCPPREKTNHLSTRPPVVERVGAEQAASTGRLAITDVTAVGTRYTDEALGCNRRGKIIKQPRAPTLDPNVPELSGKITVPSRVAYAWVTAVRTVRSEFRKLTGLGWERREGCWWKDEKRKSEIVIARHAISLSVDLLIVSHRLLLVVFVAVGDDGFRGKPIKIPPRPEGVLER